MREDTLKIHNCPQICPQIIEEITKEQKRHSMVRHQGSCIISAMTFIGLNFIAVLAAFGFSFVSGAIWFGPKTFYPIWMRERGIATAQLNSNQNKPVLLFGGTIVGVLVQTLTLGLIINSLQHAGMDIGIADGAGVGFALGVGIAAFASLSHRLFGGENIKVWLIETSNDVLNFTVAGAIIAFLN